MVMSQPSRSASASKLLQLHVWLDWKDGSAEDVTSPSADICMRWRRTDGARALRLGVKASAAAFMLHHSSHVDQQRPDDDFCGQMDRPRLAMPRVPLERHPPLYRLSQRCRSHPCSSLHAPGGFVTGKGSGGVGVGVGGTSVRPPVLRGVLAAVR